MFKLVAIYKVPENVDNFEKHYSEVHMPITKKIPLMKEIRLSKVFGSPTGKSDLYMQAELCFATKDDFKSAMKTQEAMASGKDLMGFAGDVVSVHFMEENVERL
jgi:uncharacterized protein (TIGR02118 family)